MDIGALVTEYEQVHQAHTIVLYGSRARGDATPESDIDVAAFSDVAAMYRDARLWNGMFLDGFVYPTCVAEAEPDEDLLKLSGGQIVLDARGLAQSLLERVAAREQQPVAPLPDTEKQMRRVWAQKMLGRIRRGDVEAHYRYHWLLMQLLEDHFALMAMRYPGPKRALAYLEAEDPATFATFARALDPQAPLAAVDALVGYLLARERSRKKRFMNLAAAVRAVEEAGILLVFPNQNRADPPSLWDKMYPACKMRWDWDASADPRVVKLWHLRERLAESGKVAYGKWYRGRATLFSHAAFQGMLASFTAIAEPTLRLSHEARELLEILEDDSPQSTKVLRERADLRGRARETAYARAMRELWTRLLIVGVGEVADGAFPSLAIGATRLIFEEIWETRHDARVEHARALAGALERSKGFAKQFAETREVLRAAAGGMD